MRKLQNIRQNVMGLLCICLFTFSIIATTTSLHAQCAELPGTISGTVFLDTDLDGINKEHEGVSSVLVNLFDQNGTYINHTITDVKGNYQFDGVKDDSQYRVEFKYTKDYSSTIYGEDSKSSVQYVKAPTCEADFGLIDKEQLILNNTDFAVTCFVQGLGDSNGSMPTVVTMPTDFRSDSPVNMIDDKASTGSVWGLAYDQNQHAMFSSTFVKQYAQLIEGHDVIYKNDLNTGVTSKFTSLKELGINSGNDLLLEVDDCNYGTYVGKTGLGGLEISRDQTLLYVVNIFNKSVVAIPTVNPTAETVEEFPISTVSCSEEAEYYPFALKYFNGQLYVGVTCVVPGSTSDKDSYIKVLELNPINGEYIEIFSTNYNKGNWQDYPSNNYTTDHWLTDIDFTKDGNMLIGLTDRTGHRFCNAPNRLDQQYPDLLMVYKDESGNWTLENNGVAGNLVGSGQNNGEGPGGGEFFGHDFFPANPTYHNEVALGSFTVIDGTNQVIAAVFDPEYNTYSGGVHKYNTRDGYLLASKELYTNDIDSQFGKATGLGEVELMPKKVSIEIGNYVWSDEDNDGVQDPNEKGLEGISLSIYNADFKLIGTTKTDENGHYLFNDENVESSNGTGLNTHSTYYVVLESWQLDQKSVFIEEQPYFLTKSNIGAYTQADINDNDAEIAVNMNPAIDGFPYIEVHTLEGGDNNHSYDFGVFRASDFDLALRKVLVKEDAFARLGDQVEFAIDIINQGGMVARNVEVVDYIPSGMTLASIDKNKGWSIVDGNAYYTLNEDIQPEETKRIFITLLINEGYTNDEFINYAEISGAQTEFGTDANDVDSEADSNVSNDSGGVPFQSTDNQVDDEGTIDEDDHDVAMVRIFDLALTKKIVNAKSKYVAGDVVDFEIRVFNQGNVDAKNVTVVDYQSPAFSLASTSVDEWSKTETGNYSISIPSIKVGQSKSVTIHMTLNDVPQHLGINYAEILSAFTKDNEEAIDIDSDANEIQGDDKGAQLFTETNNMVTDRGTIDEDDHDVAGIPFDRFDLALMKTINKRYVKVGEEVEFTIEIANQGTIPAGRIQIVDYMPKELTIVEDEQWHVDPADPTRFLKMLTSNNGLLPENGLLPGEKVKTTIRAIVNENVADGRYVNYSEIAFAEDTDGIDRTNDDFDSTPDKDMLNDLGGVPDTKLDNLMIGDPSIDEDDHDPAAFVVYATFFAPNCICLNNSAPDELGQYYTVLSILGSTNSDWRILEVEGMEMGLNAIGEVPDLEDYTQGDYVVTTPYNTTDFLYESNLTFFSFYTLEGITMDGQPVNITLTDGTDTLVLNKPACNYTQMEIEGEDVVCQSTLMEYCVDGSFDGPFEWTLPEGGTIEGPTDENCVMVRWNEVDNEDGSSEDSGPFQLYVSSEESGDCIAADSIGVKVGVPGGELACISNVNLSLGDNCEVEVTPDVVLTHDIEENVVYDVVLMDVNGNMQPDNIIDASDVGSSIVVKVFEPCTGNSCWSTLYIEDKTEPTFEVQDTVVGCYAYNNLVDPVATDNCSNDVTVTQIGQEVVKQVCDGDYTFEITKTYVATDASGNQSEPYERLIQLARVDLEAIEFPEDYTVMNDNPLYCQDYDLDEKGNPNVSETGIPSLEGIGIYPYQDVYCNMGVTYTDEVSQVSNCVVKVQRKWTVYEWYCEQNLVKTHTQTINIIDGKNPVFKAPENIEIATNTGQCEATVQLPGVVASDDCSTEFRVDITYPGGFIENSNGASVVLPLGEHIVQYTVYDECLNSSTESFVVNVIDTTPPVMTCTQNTVISLNVNGDTYAYAESFNNGTVDDCLLDFIEVKRMDDGSGCNVDNSYFSDKVSFCCEDVNDTTQVVLRAVDVYGNENFCMVNVIVTDKIAPQISCPGNMTIECDATYDPNNLAATFGEATAYDNCADVQVKESSTISINSCYEGYIIRTFTTTDGTTTVGCTQLITIVNSNTFSESQIKWPEDYTTNESCNLQGLEPDNLSAPYNKPVITKGNCENVSIALHTDKVFTIPGSDDACFKIIRRWEVVDACNFDEEDNPISYFHDQTIVVSNEINPEFTSIPSDTTKCIIGNCDEGDITLSISATDDCTPADMLEWTYNIDLDSDGTFDITQSGKGGTIDVSGTYKLGSHKILYTFNDLCGNSETTTQNFTLVNCDLPVASCQDINVAIEPMDTDGDGEADAEMAIVPVDAIDNDSYHPCDEPITLAFDSLGIEKEIVFDCSSVGVQIVKLYVITANGDYDVCEAEIEVQDNNDVNICPEFKDCIVWPDTLLNITTCLSDYNPATLNSEATVIEDCFCDQYDVEFSDTDVSNPDDACTKIEREWKVTFSCSASPVVCTYVQAITIENGEAPKNVVCPEDITVTSTSNTCESFINIPLPTFDEGCTFGVTITNDSEFATSNTGAASGTYPVGTTTFNYFVTNECGLSSSCAVSVTVLDGVTPDCNTQNIEVILDDSGTITIAEDAVNNGSVDNCSNGPLTFDTEPTTFTCDDLGDNTVTLTVTDPSGNVSICDAVVTVKDTVAPICNAQNINYTIITVNEFYVLTEENIEQMDNGSFDPCGEIVSYTVTPDTFTCADIGVNDVIFTVTDNNGNSSSCETTITIMDLVAPICNAQDITINVETDGETVITADQINNGSTDPCGGIASLELDNDTFTCDDLGENTVVLTVTDNSGNTSTCEATVTVENANELMCVAENVTVFLDATGTATVTAEEVGGGSMAPCGSDITLELDDTSFFCNDSQQNPSIVTLTVTDVTTNESVSCTAEITVLDTIKPMITCPDPLTFDCDQDLSDPSIFGAITFSDNCPGSLMTDTTVVDNRNDCGIGTIERTYTATDISGNSSSCTQIITIELGTPFQETNITWPESPLTLEDCSSVDPVVINSLPVLDTSEFNCFNLSVNHEDEGNSMDCMTTFERTWTVIDSCQFDGNGAGVFTFVQVINVNDNQAPVITTPGDTIVAFAPEDGCEVAVDLSGYMVEDCNSIATEANNSPFATNNDTLDASGVYPGGITNVILAATDACGNSGTAEFVVNVRDTIPPVTDCEKVQPIIGDDGTVTITPQDMIVSFSDNCTPNNLIEFRFIEEWTESDDNPFDNPFTTSLTLDCDDVVNNPFVTILFFDQSMNWGICIGPVQVMDPNNVCGTTSPSGIVNGNITNKNNQSISNVNLFLTGMTEQGTQSNANGHYGFNGLDYGLYTLRPEYDEELLNGVSTLDMILIQKHILGLESIDNPYGLIAADVNNSGTISGTDIVILKKNLLGLQEYFNNNKSFRFVEKNHVFPNPENPFAYDLPESSVFNLGNEPVSKDYTAIKIGDINNTYQVGGFISNDIDARSNEFELYVELDEEMTNQERIDIPVYAGKSQLIQGLQLSLNIEGFAIDEVKAGLLDIDDEDYVVTMLDEKLTIVWMGENTEVRAHEELFTIELINKNKGSIDVKALNTFEQMIVTNTYDVEKVILRTDRNASAKELTTLSLNEPNPWTTETQINFTLDKDVEVIFSFYSMDGRLIYSKNIQGKQGANTLLISKDELNATGVILYEMRADQIILTNRMIKLK